jgi:pimeloyl-ACP methyl ester carboxylesterase
VLLDPVFAPRLFYLYARAPWVFPYWRQHFPMAKAALRRRSSFPSREAALAAYTGRGAFRSWGPGFLDGYVRDGLTEQPDGSFQLSCAPAFEAACFAGQRHDPHRALSDVHCRVDIVKAERGSTCRAPLAERIAKTGGALETAPGSSHFLPMEHPDLCARHLADALVRNGLSVRG